MLAAVLKEFDRLVLEDVPVPEPGLGEVVVRIRSCGICATDYKAIKGIRRNVTFPFIPGHEPSGIVAKVGTGVTMIILSVVAWITVWVLIGIPIFIGMLVWAIIDFANIVTDKMTDGDGLPIQKW